MLANLRALFDVLVDIILLRRGPEHLPASWTLLGIFVVAHIVIHVAADQLFFAALVPALAPSLLGEIIVAAIILLWFRMALRLAGKPERFVQTAIAVFFTSILAVVMVPLLAALLPYAMAAQKAPSTAPPAPGALVMLFVLTGIWILAMLARIVKSAFEWPWGAAIAFAIVSAIGVPLMLASMFGAFPRLS